MQLSVDDQRLPLEKATIADRICLAPDASHSRWLSFSPRLPSVVPNLRAEANRLLRRARLLARQKTRPPPWGRLLKSTVRNEATLRRIARALAQRWGLWGSRQAAKP